MIHQPACMIILHNTTAERIPVILETLRADVAYADDMSNPESTVFDNIESEHCKQVRHPSVASHFFLDETAVTYTVCYIATYASFGAALDGSFR